MDVIDVQIERLNLEVRELKKAMMATKASCDAAMLATKTSYDAVERRVNALTTINRGNQRVLQRLNDVVEVGESEVLY